MSVERARMMRKQLTPQEARLWIQLKALRAEGFHFRRQAPFRGYYLDLVCFSRRLAIEVDGSQHGMPDGERHDAVRGEVLGRDGFRVLRFWNSEVNSNFDGVMRTIWMALNYGCPTRPPSGATLPIKGRD